MPLQSLVDSFLERKRFGSGAGRCQQKRPQKRAEGCHRTRTRDHCHIAAKGYGQNVQDSLVEQMQLDPGSDAYEEEQP